MGQDRIDIQFAAKETSRTILESGENICEIVEGRREVSGRVQVVARRYRAKVIVWSCTDCAGRS